MTASPQDTRDRGEIVIYQAPDGETRLDVSLSGETMWLSLNQLAALFERDKSVISRHLHRVFADEELDRESTVAFFATVQSEGDRIVTRQVEYFNLDAILSVGYRVNSRRGTQFRIWATNVLRQHLIRGYSVNERRLRELRLSLRLVAHALEGSAVTSDEAAALLRVVTDYAYALDLLDDYDHQRVTATTTFPAPAVGISYEEALAICAKGSARHPSSASKRTTACTAR